MSALVFTKLLRWYDKFGRDLPWRNTRDAYKILLSEIMLQQTQVRRVIDYYERWLQQFPDWSALSKASTSEVIRAWSGLGYNRRALALQAIAKHIAVHGEPIDYEGWLALKGIGPYTAAAVSVFHLHLPVLPVDTNIRRVLGRVVYGQPFPTPAVDKRLHRSVESSLASVKRFYDVPQALFDLANTHCLKTPTCETCPLRKDCLAAPKFLSGRVRTPKRSIKKTVETIHAGKKYPDRIYRGRILKLAQQQKKGIAVDGLGLFVDPQYRVSKDEAWILAMVERLVKDGLLIKQGGRLLLP